MIVFLTKAFIPEWFVEKAREKGKSNFDLRKRLELGEEEIDLGSVWIQLKTETEN